MYLPEGLLFETHQNRETIATLPALQEAKNQGALVEGRVSLCDSDHNLWVDLPCCRGVIPRKEGALGIAEGTVRDIALIARVGKAVCFVVQEITTDEQGQPLAILSRRLAQLRCRTRLLSTRRAGDIIDVTITHLEPFGAFCDIGCGLPSLIPIDHISVSRIFHPGDRFVVGQQAKAIIKALEPSGKVHLSHKELLGTWEENAARFAVGETVTGIIRTVESYGSFVELAPNLAGLAEPKEGVRAGQQAAVFIKNMIPEKMKVKLIIVDAFDAPHTPPVPSYFYQGSHIRRWCYSPADCYKQIETVFEE